MNRLRQRLFVRALEDRTAPATFTVSNLADSGADSLRDCVSKANAAAGADIVDFKSGLTGTITLTSGEIAVNDPVTISGPGAALLTVSGNNTSRIFDTVSAVANAAIELSHMTLTQGRASASGGGAILTFDELLTVKACAITNCLAFGSSSGGAIAIIAGGKLVMEDSTLFGNVSLNNGGAIRAISGSSVTIRRSTLSDNIADGASGACHFSGVGSFVLESCTLSGNKAFANQSTYQNGGGGAIGVFGNPTELLLRNCTLSGNSTSVDGGAVLLDISTNAAEFQNCTLTNNSANIYGGAFAIYSNTGTVSLTSTIVAGNDDFNFPDIFCSVQTFIDGGGHNLISVANVGNFTMTGSGNLTGTISAPLDAKLAPLANNGGPTKTHMLLTGSPALNKGSNPAGLSTDQRGPGYLRVFNTAADIGAVEFQPPPLVVLNTNDSGAGSLRQAVLDANSVVGSEAITFDPVVFATPQTITLTSGEISISDAVSINGPGASLLTISGNNASRIFNITGAPAAATNSIVNLTLTAGNPGFLQPGGAIRGENANLILTDCAMTANTAFGGGALSMSNGTLTATRCAFIGNSASSIIAGSGSGGIAMIGSGSKAVIRSCTISGNSAPMHGGIYAAGYLNMSDTTVSGNGATSGFGGGIVARSTFAPGALTIRNCTISGNCANTDGGGVWTDSGTLVVQNSTIANNSASGIGGGIRHSGTISLESTIVSGNTNATAPDISSAGTVNVKTSAIGSPLGFTLTNLGGNLAFGTNLKLGPLQNNGGPTLTHLPANDSPLIDVGSNPAASTTDQRGTGFPRVIGTTSDIGAVEILGLVVTNTNNSGLGSLRQTILHANSRPGPDTITFDAAFFNVPRTITLTTGELAISDAVTIIGPGAALATISGNNASRIFNTSSAAKGAAISIAGLTLTQGKSASDEGGAIFSVDEALTLTNCAVTGNSAFFDGGGINIQGDGTLTLQSCTVSGNTAGDEGGGIYFHLGGSFTIRDSTISGNIANGTFTGGGGLYFFGTPSGPLLISNSTFSGNVSKTNGGGVVLRSASGTLMVQNSTFTGNQAGGNGGGIARMSSTISITLESTIVSGNSAGSSGPDLSFDSATFIAGNNNLIGIADNGNFGLTGSLNLTGTQAAPLDAKLGPLANNGGPTMTHALLAGSPATNNGLNPAGLANDQRGSGFARSVGPTDIGAFELQVAPAKVISVQINDGSAQRSRVTSLLVTFDQPPVFAGSPTASFQLKRQSDNALVSLSAVLAGNTVTLSFTGGVPFEFGSLADGRYTLTALASQITNLDGDGNGAIGDNYELASEPNTLLPPTNIFRLFGDVTGDGAVSGSDFNVFRTAFGGSNPMFDFDNDGFVGNSDFNQFKVRFGASI